MFEVASSGWRSGGVSCVMVERESYAAVHLLDVWASQR